MSDHKSLKYFHIEKIRRDISSTTGDFVPIESYFPNMYFSLQKSCDMILSNQLLDQSYYNFSTQKAFFQKIIAEMTEVESDILNVIPSEWKKLGKFDEKYFCKHTFSALSCLYLNPEFQELNSYHKNLLLWAMIFHDIVKRGAPLVIDRDPFHPFPCASKSIEIFHRLGYLKNPEVIPELISLINASFALDGRVEIMDNTNLHLILAKIFYLTGLTSDVEPDFESYLKLSENGSTNFWYEIIAIILLHQSLDLNPIYPNLVTINKSEVLRYLSPRLVYLLYIFHEADTNSYTVMIMNSHRKYNKIIKKQAERILGYFSE